MGVCLSKITTHSRSGDFCSSAGVARFCVSDFKTALLRKVILAVAKTFFCSSANVYFIIVRSTEDPQIARVIGTSASGFFFVTDFCTKDNSTTFSVCEKEPQKEIPFRRENQGDCGIFGFCGGDVRRGVVRYFLSTGDIAYFQKRLPTTFCSRDFRDMLASIGLGSDFSTEIKRPQIPQIFGSGTIFTTIVRDFTKDFRTRIGSSDTVRNIFLADSHSYF